MQTAVKFAHQHVAGGGRMDGRTDMTVKQQARVRLRAGIQLHAQLDVLVIRESLP